MIMLDVTKYCHDCNRFKPLIKKDKNSNDTIISCSYYNTCNTIAFVSMASPHSICNLIKEGKEA